MFFTKIITSLKTKTNRIVKTITVRKRLKILFVDFSKKKRIQQIHTKIQLRISHEL